MVRNNSQTYVSTLSQAAKGEDSDAEGLRVKLRAAVKKGKAIEKQRADLEAQLAAAHAQVPHCTSTQACPFSCLSPA